MKTYPISSDVEQDTNLHLLETTSPAPSCCRMHLLQEWCTRSCCFFH